MTGRLHGSGGVSARIMQGALQVRPRAAEHHCGGDSYCPTCYGATIDLLPDSGQLRRTSVRQRAWERGNQRKMKQKG